MFDWLFGRRRRSVEVEEAIERRDALFDAADVATAEARAVMGKVNGMQQALIDEYEEANGHS